MPLLSQPEGKNWPKIEAQKIIIHQRKVNFEYYFLLIIHEKKINFVRHKSGVQRHQRKLWRDEIIGGEGKYPLD